MNGQAELALVAWSNTTMVYLKTGSQSQEPQFGSTRAYQ